MNFLSNNKVSSFLFGFIFFSLLISLGSFPDLNNYNFNSIIQFDLKIINFFRKNLILIIPILLIVLFFNSDYKNLKISKINKLFFIYILSQLIFLFYRYFFDKNIFLEFNFHIHFIYCSMLVIFLFIILENQNNRKIYLNFFYIICLLIFLIIFVTKSFFPFKTYLYDSFFSFGENKLNNFINFIINSNGLGRYHILAFFLFYYLFLNQIYLNNFKKIFFFFSISVFFAINVLKFDSRFLFLALIVGSLLILIFSRIELKKKLIVFFVFYPITFISFQGLNQLSDIKINSLRIYMLQGELIRYHNVIIKKEDDKRYHNQETPNIVNNGYSKLNFFTTGRVEKWSYLLNYSLKNYFLGFAPEYDRDILIQKNKSYAGNDAANGLIYALISSGFIGVIVYLTLFYNFIKKIYALFLLKKLINFENVCLDICIIFNGVLLFRSFFENGFMSWNFDFILSIFCLNYIFLFSKDSYNH